MSKSTPDSATSDQTIEPGSSRLADIPNVTCRILSVADFRSYLYFRSESDDEIRITRAENPLPFSAWKFYKLDDDTYNIRSYPDSHLYLTWTTSHHAFARVHSGGPDQIWVVEDAGNGLIYLRRFPTTGVVAYLRVKESLIENDTVFMGYGNKIKEEKFMLILAR